MNTYLKWKEWYQVIDPKYYSISAKLIYGCGLKFNKREYVDKNFKDF